ncbi:MAG: methylated-DNA--[protein]-cysteine S-methyltransferase [Phycisphaerae bacterium]|nr:methylated-DNA--[protein]-cysteine S-methyltransferase [Phycisphaerae bacterium]
MIVQIYDQVRRADQAAVRGRNADSIVTTTIESPIGWLVAGATAKAVCMLEFVDPQALAPQEPPSLLGGRAHMDRTVPSGGTSGPFGPDGRLLRPAVLGALRRRFRCAIVPGDNEHTERLKDEVARYFARKLRTFTVPIAYPGTAFQQAVWERLLRIPYGERVSYEQVAVDIGKPRAQRAVGTANGTNRIAIVIPCHRVVNKDGKLGGYGGEPWRKQFLLDLERGDAGGCTGSV